MDSFVKSDEPFGPTFVPRRPKGEAAQTAMSFAFINATESL